jgi:hypothetical protein
VLGVKLSETVHLQAPTELPTTLPTSLPTGLPTAVSARPSFPPPAFSTPGTSEYQTAECEDWANSELDSRETLFDPSDPYAAAHRSAHRLPHGAHGDAHLHAHSSAHRRPHGTPHVDTHGGEAPARGPFYCEGCIRQEGPEYLPSNVVSRVGL